MTADAVADELIKLLKTLPSLREIKFIRAFPGTQKPIPVRSPIVAAQTEKIIFSRCCMGSDEAKDACVTVKFTAHTPYLQGGAECERVLCRVCEALIMQKSLPIEKIESTSAAASRNTDSFVMSANAVINCRTAKKEG